MSLENSDLNRDPGAEDKEVIPAIVNAADFDGLFTALDGLGGLQGSTEYFDKKELKRRINKYLFGELSIDDITRTGGLRDKVAELNEKHMMDEIEGNEGY